MMQAPMFDSIARNLGNVSTRRGFLRALGGAAALTAVAATGMGESAVAKRKKGKGNGKGGNRKSCRNVKCRRSEDHCVRGRCVPIERPVPPPAPPAAPEACTSWILSGGPDPGATIVVDDDLVIDHYVDGGQVYTLFRDRDKKANTWPPIRFKAFVGDTLRIGAYDENPACRSLSPLWLHCASTGQKRQVFAGNNDGCAAGRTAGAYFVDEFVEVRV